MADLGARLNKIMEVGDLTVADLRAWFGLPYPTVRSWVKLGREPRAVNHKKLVDRRLKLLETAVNRGKGLPPPAGISAHARPGYVRQIRDGLEAGRISPRHPA